MNRYDVSKGFALPAAIFVVVVLGAVVVAMGRLNSAQTSSSILALQGSRAFWAAQSGVEWGVHTIDNGAVGVACFSDTQLSGLAQALSSFTVDVTCSRRTYKEGSATDNVFIYDITAEATYGSGPADPDYVYRKVEATLAVKL